MQAVFDLVDDTVVSGKGIVAPLVDCIEAVLDNTYGRRVLLYLLAHRSSKYFTPEQLAPLARWDGNPHTKKDHAARIGELVALAMPAVFTVGTPSIGGVCLCACVRVCVGHDEFEKRKFFFPQLIDCADVGCLCESFVVCNARPDAR